MAFEFHKNKHKYFDIQTENAESFVIPFIEEVFPLNENMTVLEIGCAEGGVLKAFLKRGCKGVGVELSVGRAKLATEFLHEFVSTGQAEIVSKNIYDEGFRNDFRGRFDLIVLKDVIEHIHDQEKLMHLLQEYLSPIGKIFFGFPPWQMPYGGHQQVASNKLASILPYYHLLPVPLYRMMLKMFGESSMKIENLLEIKETGISIGEFERIAKKTQFNIANKTLYLVNPIYQWKFNLKARKQFGLFGSIPFFRNFVTTCAYYLIGSNKSK